MRYKTLRIRNFAPKGIWRIYWCYVLPMILLKPLVLLVTEDTVSWVQLPYDITNGVITAIIAAFVLWVGSLIWKKLTNNSVLTSLKHLFIYIWVFICNPFSFYAGLEKHRAKKEMQKPFRGELYQHLGHGSYIVEVFNNTNTLNYIEEVHVVNEVGVKVGWFTMFRIKDRERLHISVPPQSKGSFEFLLNQRIKSVNIKEFVKMNDGSTVETDYFTKIIISERPE